MGAKDNNGSKVLNLYIQSSKEVTSDPWNTLLNVFNNTISRLYKKIDVLKKRKFKNQERIDRSEGTCPIPQCEIT